MASFVFDACFVMQYLVSWFCNHLAEEREREREREREKEKERERES